MIVRGGDFFAFQINLVSLAGPGHEKESKFLKRVLTCNTDGWTRTGDPTHSKKLGNELNLGGAKGAVTPRSKATGVNDPHSEDNLTTEKTEKYQSLAGRLLHVHPECSTRHDGTEQ